MRKFIIQDINLSKHTGQHVFLKADKTQTLNFDLANIFIESEAKLMKAMNDKLELIEVNVSLV